MSYDIFSKLKIVTTLIFWDVTGVLGTGAIIKSLDTDFTCLQGSLSTDKQWYVLYQTRIEQKP